MLAYVFWHVPRPDVAAGEYERAHREFHEVLWDSALAGVRGTRVHRLPAIPWLGGRAGYEDWHFIDDSATLDVLNDAAVTATRRLPHERIAELAASGTAGLYSLRAGFPIAPGAAYWLHKPASTGYADFDRATQPLVEAGSCLWSRRMTLGPAPEFCLHATRDVALHWPSERLAITVLFTLGLR